MAWSVDALVDSSIAAVPRGRDCFQYRGKKEARFNCLKWAFRVFFRYSELNEHQTSIIRGPHTIPALTKRYRVIFGQSPSGYFRLSKAATRKKDRLSKAATRLLKEERARDAHAVQFLGLLFRFFPVESGRARGARPLCFTSRSRAPGCSRHCSLRYACSFILLLQFAARSFRGSSRDRAPLPVASLHSLLRSP